MKADFFSFLYFKNYKFMRKIAVLSLLFLVLMSPCFAYTNISSCSVLNVSGEEYRLTADIINSSTSMCINIEANNVILDCQGNIVDGDDTTDYGIYVYRDSQQTTNITIKNCIVTDWNYANVYFENANENQITNTTFNSSPGDGILLYISSWNNLSNITANSNGYAGFDIYQSSFNTILNSVANHNGYDGVYLFSAWDNNLSNITTIDNDEAGFYLEYSSSNTFSEITANSNYGGIVIGKDSDNNTVANSTISNNTNAGLWFDEDGDLNPEYNKIYNCLLNNSVNVKIDDGIPGENYFNTTKQTGTRIYSNGNYIGGNYYTNSSGNGYSDTCTDSDKDGFCDNVLNLSNGTSVAWDYLPLSDEYVSFSITLNSPLNQTVTNNIMPDFNFTVSGTESSYSCELFINDTGYGTAIANDDTPTIITANQSLSDGTYDWYINCSAEGVTNQNEIREITIDTVTPSISNQQILTNYYNGTVNISNTNFVTDKKQIKVNVSSSDTHLDSVWARIYNSITDYLMSLISGTIYGVNINLDKGSYNISSFVNDTAGNQNNTANQSVTVSDLDLSSYITVSDKWDTYKDIVANLTVNKVKWINDTGNSLPYKLNILGYYVNGGSCEVNDVSYSVSGGICDYTHTINKDSVYPDLEFYDSNYGNGIPVTQTLGAEQTPSGKWYRNVTLNYYLPNGSTAPQGTFTNSTTLALCVDSTITTGEYIKYYNGTDFVDITPSTSGSWEKKTVGSKTFYVIKDDFCNGDGIMDFKVKVESNS